MANIHVPCLRAKLKLLLQRSKHIKTFAALAGKLYTLTAKDGIRTPLKPQNISVWINGNDGDRAPEMVPEQHLCRISQLFDLVDDLGNPKIEVMRESDFEEFKRQVCNIPSHRRSYRQLLIDAEVRAEFAVMADETLRGVSYEQDTESPTFLIGERVRLKLSRYGEWANMPEVHALFLVEDNDGVAGVPVEKGAEHAYALVPADGTVIPAYKSPAPSITAPAGPQAFYALLTGQKLPQVLYKRVLAKDRVERANALDEIVEELSARSDPWTVLMSPYIAIYPQRK